MVLAPRAGAPGPALPDTDSSNFELERAYLLNSVDVEQQLFGELIKPLVDRFLIGFNATVGLLVLAAGSADVSLDSPLSDHSTEILPGVAGSICRLICPRRWEAVDMPPVMTF